MEGATSEDLKGNLSKQATIDIVTVSSQPFPCSNSSKPSQIPENPLTIRGMALRNWNGQGPAVQSAVSVTGTGHTFMRASICMSTATSTTKIKLESLGSSSAVDTESLHTCHHTGLPC